MCCLVTPAFEGGGARSTVAGLVIHPNDEKLPEPKLMRRRK